MTATPWCTGLQAILSSLLRSEGGHFGLGAEVQLILKRDMHAAQCVALRPEFPMRSLQRCKARLEALSPSEARICTIAMASFVVSVASARPLGLLIGDDAQPRPRRPTSTFPGLRVRLLEEFSLDGSMDALLGTGE